MTQKIQEPVHEWVGYAVRVSLERPDGKHIYYQHILDSRALAHLKHLKHPDRDLTEQELYVWSSHNRQAERVRDAISDTIAAVITEGFDQDV